MSLAVELTDVSHVVIVLSVWRSAMHPSHAMLVLAPVVPMGSDTAEFQLLELVFFRPEISVAMLP